MSDENFSLPEFQPFSKIPRLSREIVITEKIDGTNAQILITESGQLFAGSRNRWLTLDSDNYGFCRWVNENAPTLLKLGPGRHFGEWWGNGIQRGYGQKTKRFSLFNVKRWEPVFDGEANIWAVQDAVDRNLQVGFCSVVPVLYRGPFDTDAIQHCLDLLAGSGSVAAPGFKDPEGIIIYHTASGHLFKKTIKGDEAPKTLLKNPAENYGACGQ